MKYSMRYQMSDVFVLYDSYADGILGASRDASLLQRKVEEWETEYNIDRTWLGEWVHDVDYNDYRREYETGSEQHIMKITPVPFYG